LAGVNRDIGPEIRRHGFASRLARQQYAALAWARLRTFYHSLRSRRGGLDLSAGILTYMMGLAVALGPSFGLGFGAWLALTHHHPLAITAEFWAVFVVWQVLSALAPALAGQNPEMNHLLRYPLSFGSWVLLYLVYGLMSPASIIGVLWCTALWIGISVARPDLLGSAALALAIFALFNLLLSRAILAWVERWMARRRTREILTAIFLVVALSAQVLNPALYQHRHRLLFGLKPATLIRVSDEARALQRLFPPGLASASVLNPSQHERAAAMSWLLLWMLAAGGALMVRLQAESLGESLSEAPRRAAPAARTATRSRRGLGFTGPVAAVFEKDLRYLLRSGPLLYALAAPLVMVFLFSSTLRDGVFSAMRTEYALPSGLAWAFLGLTRLVFNNFGGEGEGIQFYFLSPTPARLVVLGKNALHTLLFALEVVLIGAMILFRFGWPPASMLSATLAWLLFAVPANFAVGNTLSILMPYRTNMTRMRAVANGGSMGNALFGVLAQFGLLLAGAAAMVPFALLDRPWLATPVLLVLAAISIAIYLRVLSHVDGMVEKHRESLTLQVMKAR
jgi:ABC-2 type transport system permease protein